MGDALDLACDLVRLDTRGGGERVAADLVAGRLTDAGLRVHLDEPEPGRANLVARTRDATGADRSVATTLSGHLDTVPADDDAWSFDPLAGDLVDGRLRGRGASDMKAGVAAMVEAAVAHARAGGGDLQVVFTFGEETGCDGARALDRTLLAPSPLLVVGEMTGNRPLLGHKGALWLRLTARGVSAHGSRPELGHNALVDLARAALAVHAHEDWPASDTHGPTTVNVGTFHAGLQPNLVPDHAEARVDLRLVPGADADTVESTVAGLVGDGVVIERLVDLPVVDTDPATVGRACRLLADGATPGYATYFTDAAVLAGALGGAATIVSGPGDPDQAHVTDETCSVARIDDAVRAYGRLLAGR
ncbi:M20 family metallopeptidase [Actinomycetospora termitidis]|uniref:M20/M25/M40 family metallo-hydrolase n=1 Tax=Actinomycetospora termitidis TaxID=3053470 RepID=A0ABT7MFI8_9PSEU|nr:M20/M25/M40 family metallo-hydrolase [Actinomycetospora sp. Odt1-22]MDL5158128.1 M20/M25/M40 family metallo-hydrolase [Actinomycetospora sp. Odt1-22]